MKSALGFMLRADLITGAVYLMLDDFQDDCDYWLPAWRTLEGTAKLFQSIILWADRWPVHHRHGCVNLQRAVVSARLALLRGLELFPSLALRLSDACSGGC